MSERERFEAWWRDFWIVKASTNALELAFTKLAWDAWQAALADRPEQPVAREQALLDAMAKCKRQQILFDDEGRISSANGAEACFDAIDELRTAAPVARPEPAQPVAYMFQVRDTVGATPTWREFAAIDFTEGPGEEVISKLPLVYAAPPSHPAPSEAGAERQWTMVEMVDDQPITTMPERCLKWPCSSEGSMATLRPVRAPHGKWYMQCPLCDVSYGECEEPAKGDAGVVEGWNRTTDGTIGQP